MTDLSPAAQAVLKAACIHHGLFNEEIVQRRRMVAAAMRAVADQVGQTPADLGNPEWKEGVLLAYRHLLAIAAELEGSND